MQKTSKILYVAAALFIVLFAFLFLRELKTVLIPFILAVIISFLFEPLYIWLKSKKVPGWAAIVLIILIIILIFNVASVFIVTSINSFSADFPKYEVKFNALLQNIFTALRLSNTDLENFKHSLDARTLILGGSLTTMLTSVFSGVIVIFGDFVLILIYVVFILSELGSLRERISRAFSEERAEKINTIINEIFYDVKKYITVKTLINLLQGVIFGFILWVFGVDFYIVWGFLCFFSHYVPNIGSLISTILPGLIAFLQFDNIVTPIIIIALLIIVQNLIGNVMEPKFLGDRLDLSPLLLIFSLILWGYVWGIVGMVLSVPIMSMIKIILSKFESTKQIAVLMSYKRPQISGLLSRRRKPKA